MRPFFTSPGSHHVRDGDVQKGYYLLETEICNSAIFQRFRFENNALSASQHSKTPPDGCRASVLPRGNILYVWHFLKQPYRGRLRKTTVEYASSMTDKPFGVLMNTSLDAEYNKGHTVWRIHVEDTPFMKDAGVANSSSTKPISSPFSVKDSTTLHVMCLVVLLDGRGWYNTIFNKKTSEVYKIKQKQPSPLVTI